MSKNETETFKISEFLVIFEDRYSEIFEYSNNIRLLEIASNRIRISIFGGKYSNIRIYSNIRLYTGLNTSN